MNPGGIKSRKSSGSESGGETMDRDDIWDDKLIIKNYDESLALFREEVAKRLAMDTNKKVATGKGAKVAPVDGVKIEADATTDEGTNVTGTYEEEKGAIESSDGKATTFKLGEYVRATYEDGVDYEAKIIRIDRDNDCLIRYVGYNNEQIVQIEDLLPSWGRKARRQQRVDAAEANADCQMEVSDDEKLTKRASKIRIDYSPSMGRHEGGFSGMRSSATPGASFMIPPPPPMPPMLEDADDAESENLSAMLMSWYMSGYYTGLYHGQRMAQQQQQQQQQQHQKRARQS